jgi:hypothetical protein
MTIVVVACGPTASPRSGKRLGSPPHKQQPRTSHLRADAGPCIAELKYFGFASAMFKTRKLHYLCISFVTHEFL